MRSAKHPALPLAAAAALLLLLPAASRAAVAPSNSDAAGQPAPSSAPAGTPAGAEAGPTPKEVPSAEPPPAASAEVAPRPPSVPALPSSGPPKPKTLTVAILDLLPLGAPKDLSLNLTAVVAAEVSRYDDIRPITPREISNLLDVGRQRALLGCTDDSCLTQLVGAIGAAKILSGQIGRVENAYVLTLHLIDTRTARVEGRVIRSVPVDTDQLVDAAKSAVTEPIGSRSSSKNQLPRLAIEKQVSAQRGDRVKLDASRCYDPDGDPLRIRWRQLDGPAALLEDAQLARAEFVPAEPGRYLFAAQVTDGRAPPQEETLEVQVRERRRFLFGLGVQQLLSFNRIIKVPSGGAEYRNRAPLGAALFGGLKLWDRWQLYAELGLSYMHVYREDSKFEGTQFIDVWAPHVMAGLQYQLPFDGFNLWLAPRIGTARLFIETPGTGHQVRTEAVQGDLVVVADVPLGERFGVVAQGGLRARYGTDTLEQLPGLTEVTGARLKDNALLWGVILTGGVYLRL